MKLLAVAVGLMLAVGSSADNVTREQIVSGGRTRTYHLYAPATAQAGPAPLVVLLHGAGGRGGPLAELWTDLAKREGIILAAPDSSDISTWTTPQDGPDLLYDVVEAVRKAHAVDARRVYLFGHSAGSLFALTMALLESRYFAAAAAHAGAFRDPKRVPYLGIAQRKIPVALFIGTEDDRFSLHEARTTRDAFLAAGFPCELTEIPRHGHDYSHPDEINRMAWNFLGGHALSSDPVFDRYNIR